MGLLFRLKILHFEANNLSGTIPTQLGKLNELLHVSFGLNSLIENLPTELGKCTKLRKIDFSQNHLKGSMEIVQLKEVNEFSLNDNYFVGSIPFGIGEWKSLRSREYT